MLDQEKYEKLFSTPLLRFSVQNHAALDAALLFEGEQMRKEDEGVQKSNRAGWHSSGNLFNETAPPFQTLRAAAEQAVHDATRKVASKVAPEDLKLKIFAWMNMNPPGGFNAPHTHPGAHWSGVYYVNQPEVETGNSGMIEFLDPRSDLPNWRLFKSPSFRPKLKIRPEAGQMILFPSYLMHWVYPNESDEERVTIAFNATFSKPRKSEEDSSKDED